MIFAETIKIFMGSDKILHVKQKSFVSEEERNERGRIKRRYINKNIDGKREK